MMHQNVKIEELRWGETPIKQKYELIMGADCLFFDNFHKALLDTLKKAMDSSSVTVFVNPKRGNTTQLFLDRANK